MKTIKLMLGLFVIYCLAIPAFADDDDDVEVCNVSGELAIDFSAMVFTFSCFPASETFPFCTTEFRFDQSSGSEIFSGDLEGEYVPQKQCRITPDGQYVDCTGTGLLVGEVCGEEGSVI